MTTKSPLNYLTIITAVSICLLSLVGQAFSSEKLVLAEAGKAKCDIIIGQNAGKVERFAAEELKKYLKQISKADFEIKTDGTFQSGTAIILGKRETNKAIEKLCQKGKLELTSDSPGKEGLIIKTIDGKLVLAGIDDLGVIYAVYTFLEEQLRCVWYEPGDDVVSRMGDIAVGNLDIVQKPNVRYRAQGRITSVGVLDWGVKNKANYIYMTVGSFGSRLDKIYNEAKKRGLHINIGGHTYSYFLPCSVYYKDHPEYYSLVDDKRVASEHPFNWQLCTSNRQVIDEVAKNVIKFFKQWPEIEMIELSTNDAGGACQCDNCKEIAKKINPFLLFAHQVAEKVTKVLPDKQFGTFIGYGPGTCFPPENFELNKNLRFCIAPIRRCFAHMMNTPGCPTNEKHYKYISKWTEFSDKAYLWCYHYGVSGYMWQLLPMQKRIVRDWRFYPKLNLWGAEAMKGDNNFVSTYAFYKTAWNPNFDLNDCLNTYYERAFGRASEPMIRFWKILTDKMEEISNQNEIHYCGIYPSIKHLFDVKMVAELKECLAESLQKAKSDDVRDRINRAKGIYEISVGIWREVAPEAALAGISGTKPYAFYDKDKNTIIVAGKGNSLETIKNDIDKQLGKNQKLVTVSADDNEHVIDCSVKLLGSKDKRAALEIIGLQGRTNPLQLTIKGDLIARPYTTLAMENVSLKIYCAKTGQHKIEIGDKLNAYPEGEITLILKHCQINSADGTAYNFRIRRKSKPLIENCRLEGHTGIRIDLQFIKGSIMKDTLVKCVGAATQRYSGTGRKPLRYYGIAIEAGTTYYPEDNFNFKIVNCRIVGATNGMFISRWTAPKYLVIEDTEFFGGVNDIYAQPNANLRMKMKNCKYDKIELTGSHIKITE